MCDSAGRSMKTGVLPGKATRGLGISALFVGISGVGKTMAAEVLAGELQLDLYRIDLSAVVSKYIGETRKIYAASLHPPKKVGYLTLRRGRCLVWQTQ